MKPVGDGANRVLAGVVFCNDSDSLVPGAVSVSGFSRDEKHARP